MEIKDIKRRKPIERKICISLKVSKGISDWLKKNQVSPTKLFVGACEELMEKDKS